MDSLSILLVEDSTLFRLALTNMFARNRMLTLDVCSSSSFLKRMVKIGHDAVVIDAVTWAAGLEVLVGAVQRAAMVTPILLLGREDLLDRHLEALRAGATGFVEQTASQQVLIKAVRAIASGGVWFERSLFRKVYVEALLAQGSLRGRRLNQKEQQILALIASGRTNKEIGSRLGSSERTIKAHVSNLFRKTGAANRVELTSYAITHGLTQFTLAPTS